jgi:hypothetical protein
MDMFEGIQYDDSHYKFTTEIIKLEDKLKSILEINKELTENINKDRSDDPDFLPILDYAHEYETPNDEFDDLIEDEIRQRIQYDDEYLGDNEKCFLCINEIQGTLSPLIEQARKNAEQSGLLDKESEDNLNNLIKKFENWQYEWQYEGGDCFEIISQINEILGGEIEYNENINDWYNELDEDVIFDYIKQHHRYEIESDLSETEYENYKEDLNELLKELELDEIEDFNWDYLSKLDLYSMEFDIESVKNHSRIQYNNRGDDLDRVIEIIKKIKVYSLFNKEFFNIELLQKAGYMYRLKHIENFVFGDDRFDWNNNNFLIRLNEFIDKIDDEVKLKYLNSFYPQYTSPYNGKVKDEILEEIYKNFNLKGIEKYIVNEFLMSSFITEINLFIDSNLNINNKYLINQFEKFYTKDTQLRLNNDFQEKRENSLHKFICEIVEEYNRLKDEDSENFESINLSDSEIIKEILNDFTNFNKIDKHEIVRELYKSRNFKIDRRQRDNWSRLNAPYFMNNYSTKIKNDKIYNAFSSGQIKPERILENYAMRNKIPIEDLKIDSIESTKIRAINIKTNEYVDINLPFPKKLITWISNRCFALGESLHDALHLFYEKDIIDQPGLADFLINQELSTETKMLKVILRARKKGIEEKMIIPGKTEVSDLEEGEENNIFEDTRKGIMDYWAKNKYKNFKSNIGSEITNIFISQLMQYGYDEINIGKFLKKLNFPETANIPPLTKTIDGFVFKILEKTDPLGAVLGDITGCCQTINGYASSCVLDGFRNPDSGFLVAFDYKGDVIAQSWIRLGVPQEDQENKRIFYLDNIECIPKYQKNEKLKIAYIEFAKWLKEKMGYANVVCGAGYNDLSFPNLETKIFQDEFPNYKKHVYTDLKKKNPILANMKKWYKFSKII